MLRLYWLGEFLPLSLVQAAAFYLRLEVEARRLTACDHLYTVIHVEIRILLPRKLFAWEPCREQQASGFVDLEAVGDSGLWFSPLGHQCGSMQSVVMRDSGLEKSRGRPGGVIGSPSASVSASSRFSRNRKAKVSSVSFMP